MPVAKSSFTIDSWDQDEVDPGVAKARVRKTYSGGIEGTSVTNILLGGAEGGEMAYSGFERFDARIDGRRGGFVLLHFATMNGPEPTATWRIVAGSGSGELEGIAGTGEIVRHEDGSHDFSLDYALA